MTVAVLPRARDGNSPRPSAMAEALGPEAVRSTEDGDGLALVHVARGGDEVLPGGDPLLLARAACSSTGI